MDIVHLLNGSHIPTSHVRTGHSIPDYNLSLRKRVAQDYPGSDSNDTEIVRSAVFFPGAGHTTATPDLTFVSSDDIAFYVHSHRILPASNSRFGSKWPDPTPIVNEGEEPLRVYLEESASVLNILFHSVYNLPTSQIIPTNQELTETLHALRKYGFNLSDYIHSMSNLQELILFQATAYPIEMFALVARHRLEELAVSVSGHLLSYDLSQLTDQLGATMGAVYMRRLIFLHMDRKEELKNLLLPPAPFHEFTADCGEDEHAQLVRAWCFATTTLAWDFRPDLLPSTLESGLSPVIDSAGCHICREGMQMTVRNICVRWANVKATI